MARTKLTFEGDNRTRRAFGEINRSFTTMGGKLGGLTRAAKGFIGVFAAGSLLGFGAKVVAQTKLLDDFAFQLGVNISELSTFAEVAKLAGININTFLLSMQRMRRRAEEAAKGGGEARDTIKEMGIEARAFAKLGLEDQLLILSDRFDENKDNVFGLAEAMKLFDSEGVVMLRVLKQGADQLLRAKGEAGEYATITQGAADASRELAQGFAIAGSRAQRFGRDLLELGGKMSTGGYAEGVKNAVRSTADLFHVLVSGSEEVDDEAAPRFDHWGTLIEELGNKAKTTSEIIGELNAQVSAGPPRSPPEIFPTVSRTPPVIKPTVEILEDPDLTGLEFAIEDAIFAGAEEGGKGLVLSILRSVETNLIQQLAKLLAGAISGAGKGDLSGLGGFITGLFQPREHGGSVRAGSAYLVGEGGPELFTSGTSGTIFPLGAGGGGGGMVVNIDARGAQRGVGREIERALRRQRQASRSDRADDRMRGR